MSPQSLTGDIRYAVVAPWRDAGGRARAAASAQSPLSLKGLQTRPQLFTALRRAPTRLTWVDAPRASTYALYLQGDFVQSVTLGDSTEGATREASFEWPRDLSLQPGQRMSWAIAPCDGPKAAIAGQFWVLDNSELARLASVEEALEQIDDPEMYTIATALVLAESSLYDDAITLLDRLDGTISSVGREALLHRTLVAIFAEMQAIMPADAFPAVLAWAKARLEFHRQRLARCLPKAAASDR